MIALLHAAALSLVSLGATADDPPGTGCGQGPEGIAWSSGEFHFRVGGRQGFVLGRNPTGWQVEQFEPLFQWAAASGERIVRVHLDVGIVQDAPPGEIDGAWARQWERVFDLALARGLRVVPVFSAWVHWNDGSRGERWHAWDRNRYNAARGGPASCPAELFRDSECRRLWLVWLERLVRRWQSRGEILGWEIFSELDLATGATEDFAVEFARRAAGVIRAADGSRRPVTASLSGIGEWPRLFGDDAIDWVQVHPYADDPRYRGRLDELILESVRSRLARYRKPVFIGECGFDSGPPPGTLDDAPRAAIGVNHAIWAAMVSGAMNGRMLWWADGYDRYHRCDLRTRLALAARPVARFAAGIDFAGFAPVPTAASPEVFGAAIGGGRRIIAWCRDARCVGPDWPVRRVENQSLVIQSPGDASSWRAVFLDSETLERLGEIPVRREDGRLSVVLPAFKDSIVADLAPAAE